MFKQIHAKKGRNTRYHNPVFTWNDDIGKRLLTDLHGEGWGRGKWGRQERKFYTRKKQEQLKRGGTCPEFRQHAANLLPTFKRDLELMFNPEITSKG